MESWQRFFFPAACFAIWAAFTLYVGGVLQRRHRVGPEQLEEWRRIRRTTTARAFGDLLSATHSLANGLVLLCTSAATASPRPAVPSTPPTSAHRPKDSPCALWNSSVSGEGLGAGRGYARSDV